MISVTLKAKETIYKYHTLVDKATSHVVWLHNLIPLYMFTGT